MLKGLLTIDLTQWIAGPYLTKLLTDLEARVIKVEWPDGDVARRLPYKLGSADSGLFQQLNTGKESVLLDLEKREHEKVLRRMIAKADILVEDWHPNLAQRHGLQYPALRRINPQIIMCSLTGFGRSGPLRNWVGSGGVAAAISGARDPMEDPSGPPQGLWGDVAACTGATHAFSAILAALHARTRSGLGQYIDIALADCMFSTIEIAVQEHLHATREGKVLTRIPRRFRPFRTRNGEYLAMNPHIPAIWRRFAIAMGQPELADDPLFSTYPKRVENADALHAIIDTWFLGFEDANSVLSVLDQARVPAAVVATTEQAWHNVQLRTRQMFRRVQHPVAGPLELPTTPFRLFRTEDGWQEPAPMLTEEKNGALAEFSTAVAVRPLQRGRDGGRGSPLKGVRVLDFTRILAGPYLTRHLVDLGAQVIKVEPPTGDDSRTTPYLTAEGRSGYFMQQNCGKLSVALNLKDRQAVAIAKELAAVSDVVVENYKPGVMAELGLDYQVLRRANPALIMCSISGYGQTGPLSNRAGEVISTTAMSGQLDPGGDPEGPPQYFRHSFADVNAGSHAMAAILAALHHRDSTGHGQYLDISILDCLFSLDIWNIQRYSLSGGRELPKCYRHFHPFLVPRGDFRANDGRWLFIEAYIDSHWLRLAQATGLPELTTDQRFATLDARTAHQEELYSLLAKWVEAQGSAGDAETVLQAHGVPAAVVRTIPEAVRERHLRARRMVVPIADPHVVEMEITNSPYRFSEYRAGVRGHPPSLGEHSLWAVRDLLGYQEEHVRVVVATGALLSNAP